MKMLRRAGRGIMVVALLSGLCASAAVASEYKSWRTSNGVVIQHGGNDFLEQGRSIILEAAALKDMITDTDATGNHNTSNDPLILDVRFKPDYAMAHIPGAIWIADFNAMALPENLDKLDEALAEHIMQTGNSNIVVYCHLGQMSGLVTGVLGSLGYDVKTLKLGYNMGWLMIGKNPMGM